ncbi:MAG: excinuclease ABC subunit A, partial [Pirellulaceae bacterium]|nr:excinuclease ABC subunit A [Pirellulaceae bacterium]
MDSERRISLRGVEVHNLDCIDLDIPHRKLVVLCGVSGSGKSSLAIDTLYAEGQRRYIESFSTYTRQFLERLQRPDCDHIDGIPPAIAVTSKNTSRSSRATVGTATETADYLRLLFAKIGRVFCRECGKEVRRDSPQTAARELTSLPDGTRFMVAFPQSAANGTDRETLAANLKEDGFSRVLAGDRMVDLSAEPLPPASGESANGAAVLHVIIDRLTAGAVTEERLLDSLEAAFAKGNGSCCAFVAASEAVQMPGKPLAIDGRPWCRIAFSRSLTCEDCGITYPTPEPRLFSFNSPLGACPECEGFGNVIDLDMELVVPDPTKSIRDGAIAPWNSPAYSHELDVLMGLADEFDIPVDIPFSSLDERQLGLIVEGVPGRKFGGLKGFFDWLQRRKYKMHVRVFLSRWRSYRTCPACQGARLRPESLAARVGGRNIAEICAMKVDDAAEFFRRIDLGEHERIVARTILDAVRGRLHYLKTVGLGYLTLDRTLRTLSGGEIRRVSLTSALSSSLVNMLYVLDEPSIGLHPRDIDRLIEAIRELRDRLNTVVVVEHEEAMLRAADQVIEIGPGAGQRGGRVVFQGTPDEMARNEQSLTGDYLARRRCIRAAERCREPDHGWIRLAGA